MNYIFKLIGRYLIALFRTIGYIISALFSSTNESEDNKKGSKKGNILKQTISSEEAKEKGDKFEEYIVKKLDKNFSLKEWRSDKYIDGIYAESNLNPDLEYEFKMNDFRTTFALECKFRQSTYNGLIELAKERQIKHYKQYEMERIIPVYIVLGLGGSPTKPSELYLIPLKQLSNNYISYDSLANFKKETHGSFYFDVIKNRLC